MQVTAGVDDRPGPSGRAAVGFERGYRSTTLVARSTDPAVLLATTLATCDSIAGGAFSTGLFVSLGYSVEQREGLIGWGGSARWISAGRERIFVAGQLGAEMTLAPSVSSVASLQVGVLDHRGLWYGVTADSIQREDRYFRWVGAGVGGRWSLGRKEGGGDRAPR